MARWAESIWLERGCFARDHRQSLALRDAGKTAGAILRSRERAAGVVWLSGESGGGPDAGGRLFAGVDRRAFACQPAGCRATLRLSDHHFPPPQRRGLRGRGPTLRAGGPTDPADRRPVLPRWGGRPAGPLLGGVAVGRKCASG